MLIPDFKRIPIRRTWLCLPFKFRRIAVYGFDAIKRWLKIQIDPLHAIVKLAFRELASVSAPVAHHSGLVEEPWFFMGGLSLSVCRI